MVFITANNEKNNKKQKFYTGRYDVVFKEIFNNEDNRDILICLLEEVLEVKIEEIKYLNLEENVGNVYVRRKHFDLSLKTNEGLIQVEVNNNEGKYIYPRNMAYICSTYSKSTLRGEGYDVLEKVIQINFTYGLKKNILSRKFMVQDGDKNTFVDNFIIYEFYMDNFKELWYSNEKELIEENKYKIMLDLGLDELKSLSSDKVVKKYMNELDRINMDPEIMSFISIEEDNKKIEDSRISIAHYEGREEGLKEGREEGRKEGLKYNVPISMDI